MLNKFKKLIRDEAAPTAVEYVIMVAGVAVLVAVAVFALGGSVSNKVADAKTALKTKH